MILNYLTAYYLLKQQPLSKSFLNALHICIYIAPIIKLSENTSQIHIITMFVKLNVARLMVYMLLQSVIRCQY